MTLLSRVLGLVREMVFSRVFGAGIVMDAFIAAFRIPNLLRKFFAEGAFSQAFVPVIAEYRANRSADEARELIAQVTGTLGLVLFVITALGVLAAPVLIAVFATGFVDGDGRYELAVGMLRFTFPYLLFISLTALAGAVLNTYRQFAVPAFTPVLLNVVLIVFALWVSPMLEEPAMGLAFGVFAAGIVQLAFQLPFLLQARLLPLPRWGWAHAGVRRILKLMAPILFGSSVAQINILFDTWIASFLAAGSISWLYYSDRLLEFPLGVFGIALATVILPSLSEQHAKDAVDSFSDTLDWALRCVAIIAVPAGLGLMLLAAPIIVTLFYGGAFTMTHVAMTSASLQAFAPGLVGFILIKILAPGYFARHDTRTPVKIGIRALVLGMVLNVVFVLLLLETGWAPPHAGLAAATSLAGIFNASMLFRGLVREQAYRPRAGWARMLFRVAIANAIMVAFLVWLAGWFGDWYAMTSWARAGALVLCVAGGGGVYFAACWLTGLRLDDLRLHTSDGFL